MRDKQEPPKITLTIGQALSRPLVRELNLLSQRIKRVAGVQSVITRLDLHGCQQIVVFPQAGVDHATLLRRMAVALRVPVAAHETVCSQPSSDPIAGRLSPTSDGVLVHQTRIESIAGRATARIFTMQRLSRLIYGGLAAASLGMAWVGLVVPGIPTVPFVILTAVLAARSSPAFHQRLRQGKVFGPMIRDWEAHRAIRPQVRIQAAAATVIIVAITFAVAPPSPGMYVLVGTMAIFSLFIVFRIPVISEIPLESQGLDLREERDWRMHMSGIA